MIRSMTAFAREQTEADWGRATWELRSVNNRYLDVFVRMPEELRGLEPAVREAVGRRLSRGKVECNLRYQPAAASKQGLNVNMELAEQLSKASRRIDALLYDAGSVSSMDLLRWPGVVEAPELDLEHVGAAVLALLDSTLNDMLAARTREGEKILAMLEERCAAIVEIVDRVKDRLPEVLAAYRKRLADRLAEVREELDADRLEQEMVIVAQKTDVAEELDRLAAHVEEVRHTLEQNKPVGRRLDFLMQELNREANTLGSKSVDAEVTRASVDLKVLIEQMREQIQNVE